MKKRLYIAKDAINCSKVRLNMHMYISLHLLYMPTAVIAVVTIVLLWKFKKLQEPVIVAAAAIIGLIIYPLLRH
jgi:hypothetical protein